MIFMVISIAFIGSALTNISEISNQPAPGYKYLFTASISYGSEHMCTAIIVNNQWLLTSAVCMLECDTNFELLEIYYGSHNRTNVQRIKNCIEKIVFHSKFDRQNLINNLALVKLNTRIRFIPTVVQAVYLTTKDVPANSMAYAIGWENANQSVCKIILFDFMFLPLCIN